MRKLVASILLVTLTASAMPVMADDEKSSSSGGGGGGGAGAALGVLVVGLIVWAISGKGSGAASGKAADIKMDPQTSPSPGENVDDKAKAPGVGAVKEMEF